LEHGAGSSFTTNPDYPVLQRLTAAGSRTLTDVRDAINNAGIGVTASIIEVSDGNYSLMVKSLEGADQALRVKSHLGGVENNVLKYNPGNVVSLADSATQVVTQRMPIYY
jgi:flagellar capping protein FliD